MQITYPSQDLVLGTVPNLRSRSVSYTHLDVYKRQVECAARDDLEPVAAPRPRRRPRGQPPIELDPRHTARQLCRRGVCQDTARPAAHVEQVVGPLKSCLLYTSDVYKRQALHPTRPLGHIMQSLCGGTEAITHRRAILTRVRAKPISTTRGKPLGAEPARLEAKPPHAQAMLPRTAPCRPALARSGKLCCEIIH